MARPKKPDTERKDEVLTLRVTAEQLQYLDMMAARIEVTNGFPASRTAVALRLIELGKAALEKEYPPVRKK